MLFRKPLPLWSLVSLFVGAAAMIPLIDQRLGPPVSPPQTLTELAELLSKDVPSLYLVPVVKHRPENGIYICTQPQLREQVLWLTRHPKVVGHPRSGRWQGVALVHNGKAIEWDEQIQFWGEYGMRIGPFVFFGDPDLLQRIREVFFHHCGGNNALLQCDGRQQRERIWGLATAKRRASVNAALSVAEKNFHFFSD